MGGILLSLLMAFMFRSMKVLMRFSAPEFSCDSMAELPWLGLSPRIACRSFSGMLLPGGACLGAPRIVSWIWKSTLSNSTVFSAAAAL
jgi:hypothetical protein